MNIRTEISEHLQYILFESGFQTLITYIDNKVTVLCRYKC